MVSMSWQKLSKLYDLPFIAVVKQYGLNGQN